MFLVDANHWVFYLDEDAPEHEAVAPRLEALLDTEELLQTTVIQLEVAHFTFRRWKDQAAAPLGLFLGLPAKVASLEPDDVLGAVRLLETGGSSGLGGRDASILQAAKKHGASLLCTSDKALAKGAKANGLQVRDLAKR